MNLELQKTQNGNSQGLMNARKGSSHLCKFSPGFELK